MANDRNLKNGADTITTTGGERHSTVPNDLPDNDRDREKLQSETVIMDLPDVKDIPGQEFVHAPLIGEMADTTIASADEEGANIVGLNDDDGDVDDDTAGGGNNVGAEERAALADDTYMPAHDEDNLRRAAMDSVDFDGEPLNEGSFGTTQTESELDTPGNWQDTATESMGDSDEENKDFSLEDADTNESAENQSGQ